MNVSNTLSFTYDKNEMKHVYILTYTNYNGEKNGSFIENCLIHFQTAITGSYFTHVIIALDDAYVTREVIKFNNKHEKNKKKKAKEGLVCFEINFGKYVVAHQKSLKYYKKEKRDIIVNITQYNKLTKFLLHHMKNTTPFNSLAFFWNFMPITRCCPITGTGFFCAQFVAEALINSKILVYKTGKTEITSTGYPSSCFFICCCSCFYSEKDIIQKKKKILKIPDAAQITVGMLIDIIDEHCGAQLLCENTNANDYSFTYPIENNSSSNFFSTQYRQK